MFSLESDKMTVLEPNDRITTAFCDYPGDYSDYPGDYPDYPGYYLEHTGLSKECI